MIQHDENTSGKATVGYDNPAEGAQGVDKAPGEENASSTDNIIRDGQRGKDKNDGDPSQQSDQPIKQA